MHFHNVIIYNQLVYHKLVVLLLVCLLIGVRHGGIGLAVISGIGLVIFTFVYNRAMCLRINPCTAVSYLCLYTVLYLASS